MSGHLRDPALGLGLVVAGRVEGEVAGRSSPSGVNNLHVVIRDEMHDGLVFEAGSHGDVVELGLVTQCDRAVVC